MVSAGKTKLLVRNLEPLVRFLINVADAAQRIRIDFDGIDGRQNHCVIGAHASAFIDFV